MLAMLTKELLYDMGIKAVGDVLSILTHANAKKAEVESDSGKVVEIAFFYFFKFCLYQQKSESSFKHSYFI